MFEFEFEFDLVHLSVPTQCAVWVSRPRGGMYVRWCCLRLMECNPLSLATVQECSPSRLPTHRSCQATWPGTEARVHARIEYTVAGQVILNNFILRVFILEICKALKSGAESWISRDDWIPLLNLQWLILNVKCLLPPGTWAQQTSPETSGFGWSWAKQMRWTMAPWGEEDLFRLPQELWSLCSRTRCAGGFKVSYLLTLTIPLWDSVVFSWRYSYFSQSAV